MKCGLVFPLVLCVLVSHSQQHYELEKDIHYYSDSLKPSSQYQDSQCVMDMYYPKGKRGFATVVWFHGGGLTAGDKEIPNALKEKGFAVLSVQYRFSPWVNAPVYIEDASASVAWVFNNIGKYGGDTSLIFLSGHSAGGYLDLMVTLDKHYLAKYQIDADRIAAIIPFSGQCVTHFTVRAERGIKPTQPIIDQYSPLYFVRPDAPPILLITGDRELELFGRYEENAYMARMMKLAGHIQTTLYELQGFNHGNMPEPAFPLLIREVEKFVKEKKL